MVTTPARLCMPSRTRQKSSPSSRFHSSAPFRLGGHCASCAASGPSPRPSVPWQRTQCCWYTACPRTMPVASKPVGDWCRLVGTAGASSRCACGHGASTKSAMAATHSGMRARRQGSDSPSTNTAPAAHSSDSSTRRAWPASTTSISAAMRWASGQAGWPCTSGARPSRCNRARRPCCAACRPSSRPFNRSGDKGKNRRSVVTSSRPAPAAPAPRGAVRPGAGRRGGAGTAGR